MKASVVKPEFYLVIHGETEAHERGLVCGGGWDVPLNEEGLNQAKKLAQKMGKIQNKLRVHTLFSSPLLRCIQTTDVIHDHIKVKVRVISGLAERNMGLWEKSEAAKLPDLSPKTEHIPGGEGLARFKERVQESLDFVLNNVPKSGGRPVMVTHAFFGSTLVDVLGIAEQRLERCQLYRFWREAPEAAWAIEAL